MYYLVLFLRLDGLWFGCLVGDGGLDDEDWDVVIIYIGGVDRVVNWCVWKMIVWGGWLFKYLFIIYLGS